MSDTVGNMVMRVLRRTLQNPSKTAISDNDDTALILDLLNEAGMLLRDLYPTTLDSDFSVVVNSRTTPFPNGADFYEPYNWSWYYLDNNGNRQALSVVSTQYVYERYPQFSSDTALYPYLAYQDNNQIAVYPIPSMPITIGFKYPSLLIRRTQWADLWPYPDNWLTWMERYAQYFYEVTKGLGNPGATAAIMEQLWGQIFGKMARAKKVKMTGYRRLGNPARSSFQLSSNPYVW